MSHPSQLSHPLIFPNFPIPRIKRCTLQHLIRGFFS
jgi:hypothetical protein